MAAHICRGAEFTADMIHSVTTISLFLSLAIFVQALGEPCLVSNNRVDPSSHKFTSDCGPTEYCAALTTNVTALGGASETTSQLNSSVSLQITQQPQKRSGMQNFFLATDTFPNTNGSTIPEQPHVFTNNTATCQPKGCRMAEYPFGYLCPSVLTIRRWLTDLWWYLQVWSV